VIVPLGLAAVELVEPAGVDELLSALPHAASARLAIAAVPVSAALLNLICGKTFLRSMTSVVQGAKAAGERQIRPSLSALRGQRNTSY
jgi:hypothetical protein